MSTLLGRIDLLSPEKRELVASRLEPASFGQQRLWFLDQLQPGNRAYHIFSGVRLGGELDVDALATALGGVVRRHTVLRTSFPMIGGKLVQLVHPAEPLALPVVELGHLPADEREGEVLRLAREEFEKPFDLRAGPLLRARLLRLGGREHVFLLTFHHIVFDGWSRGIFLGELGALYRAARDGVAPALPEPAIQYADFARWQRQWLTGEVLQQQLDFWRSRLAGAPSSLPLPYDGPRTRASGGRGGHLSFQLPTPLAESLREVCRRYEVTPFMLMLTAFNLLLSRYSGSEDVSVGTPVAGRPRPELEGLIGFFVNTLVLRTDLSGNPRFSRLLERVRHSALDAYAHQDLPFERLVDELQPERDLGVTPLFQVMFSLQSAPADGEGFPDLALTPLELETPTAQFDLALSLMDTEGAMRGSFDYSRDLFAEATIERMAAHYRNLLEAVAAAPETRVRDLSILSRAERAQLAAWNDTAREYPEGALHELIEAQAARTPDAVALRFEGASLTYAELDRRAGQLAARLSERGAGPESVVGLCAERSPEMVIALLGILKAGAAYLPLDPENPAARLRYMLSHSGARVALVQSRFAEIFEGGACERLDLEEACADGDAERVRPRVLPENGAYVIYTSGTTGLPKGVMVPHRGIVNRLFWMQEAFGLGADDAVLQKTPYTFDVSVWEFFWPLMTGATLVIARPGGHRDPDYLAETIEREGITTLHFVPSMLDAFLQAPAAAGLASVRRVMCSGEALAPESVRRFHETFASAELHNLYGPTEASVDVSWWPAARGEEIRTVPIGKPIANTTLHVLDASFKPLPVGVAGELYIGGVQLARGYASDAAQTAERFVPDPYGPPGSRLYRTGDRARWLPTGEIEYLGRVDFQVKIRGYRIELGEIEHALAAHDAVRQAVVVARDDGAGDRRLVAYVVPEGEAPAVEELRETLLGKLPEYMVPAHFVTLAELPLSRNGKVDRKALPEPDQQVAGEYVAPRTPTEELLAGVWARVLRRDRVGVTDNFFRLGGHSLLATQLVSRIRGVFGAEVPLRAVFEAPTLEQLARRVDTARRGEEVRIAPADRSAPLPLSYAQERLWFLEQLDPGKPTYNIPMALRVEGELDEDALERALGEVIRRHEILRSHVEEIAGTPRLVVEEWPEWTWDAEDLSHVEEGEREELAARLAREEGLAPFDLARGPLIRVRFLKLAENEAVLLLTQHHIVTDGWSLGVLIQEVSRLYGAFRHGGTSPLAPLSVQYADFAAWQRQWLSEGAEAEQVAYWRGQLAGFKGYLDLPLDRPRPAVQSFAGATRGIQLGVELTRKLEEMAQREGVTMYMLLLASLQLLLHRYSGQDDVAVGSPIAGRGVKQVEELIGFFVNTLVLRSRTRTGERFADFLARTRESALGAYAHQDVPFERLVEEVQPERSMAHTPLFQVMFAMQNTPGEDAETQASHELRLRHQPVEGTVAKFDQSWTAIPDEAGLHLAVDYNRELFEEATIERMLGHFRRILEQVAGDATLAVDAVELLDDGERGQLAGWNDTARDYPEGPLHELIEAQAARTPDAVALRFEDASLTYAELDRRAGQLAARLSERGAGPESVVGLCAERSLEMVIALLGILKAGAAYLPLDPENPAARLQYMLAHSGARVALVQSRFAEVFDGGACDRLDLEEACADGDAERVRPRVLPENGAYVIYTSGTTGLPKGVMVPHRGIVNRLFWMQEAFGLGADDAVLQKTPYTFDVSVWEFFWPLMTGATLVIARPGGHRDPDYLADVIEREGITTLHFVPSMLDAFLQAPAAAGLGGVRRVMCSGEALAPESVRRFHQTFASAELHNLYGPTEASVDVSWWPAVRGQEVRTVPIGKPIANTTLHVLDASFKPLPVGVAGELYIGGVQLARGYASDAAQTAERFVPDPLGSGRLYRTGDRARWLPTGEIEYLGRMDFQVKIRGYRIELGEIEHALTAHLAVRDAVVVARENASGDRRLVAYVVQAANGPGTGLSDVLREALRQKLPEYMVPAQFVEIDELPLSRNGKVDRKALPEPEQQAVAEYVAPRNPTEELLAGVWAEVLQRTRVSVTENFFHAGGHSLLATQLVSRVRQLFGAEVPLRAVFEAPTLERMARWVDTAGRGEEVRIVPVPRDGTTVLPLSYAQERLWFVEQLDPGKPAYNIPLALRIQGSMDENALHRAMAEVVRRHEILRSHVEELGGTPHLVVEEWPGWRWDSEDLSHLPKEERDGLVSRMARLEGRAPFDLARGPLFRVRFVRLAEEEAVLMLTQHHIVFDGWSQGVLIREVARLYDAFRNGQPSPLPPLGFQYADFAAWQRQWLAKGAEEEQVTYWREQLAGFGGYLDLPLDRPRPAAQGFAGSTRAIQLTVELTKKLEALAQREGVTMYMVLLASLQLLLHRYSGQDDIAVGSPIAGRGVKQLEELIGFFVNTLVLRSRVRPGERFADLLARTRETALGAYAHQDVPFERLVEAVQPERSLAHTPLFQVLFTLQNTPGADPNSAGLKELRLRHQAVEGTIAKFDLHWTAIPEDLGMVVTVQYKLDLFDGATVDRMLAQFLRILEQVAGDASIPLDAVELLVEPERRQLLVEWNDTAEPLPFVPVTESFRARAALEGGHPALVDDGRVLSYAELDRLSNRLAHHLISLGVGAEDRVALALPRSLNQIVAVWGVLKAGAAFVPLDTSLPAHRLRHMVQDSGARLVLSGETAPELAHSIDWSEIEAALETCPESGPPVRIAPGQLAYVIYTSGSTGRPKGVMVQHGSLANLGHALQEAIFRDHPEHLRISFNAPLAFDSSFKQLLQLLRGHTLHIVPEPVRADPTELLGFLLRHEVDVLDCTPTHLKMLLAAGLAESGWRPRAALVGGEAVERDLWRQAVALDPAAFYNVYGPSECCVDATGCRFQGEVPVIGGPLANMRAYVLDAALKPVPAGMPGELYVGGAGVARGYVGRPRETAAAFVPDPWGEPGARLYRTGDRVRWLPTGELEFFGRVDQQVKIRGYRIEPGEIEGVLREHPAVRDAAVVVRTGERLVGYVVASGEVEEEALREALRVKLPEYMIPVRIVALDALPLTPNGKVDRRALPEPGSTRTEVRQGPATPTEELLAGIWSTLLRVEAVDREDDFFRLGGHSLLATQLVSRIRGAFSAELPLRAVFEAPTLEQMARRVETARRGEEVRIPAVDRDGPLPLSYAQERLWFLEQLDPGKPTYNIPLALRIGGELDEDALQRALREVIGRHEILRSHVEEIAGTPRLVVEEWPEWTWSTDDLSGLGVEEREARAAALAREDAAAPFDLAHGPLIRARFVRLAADEAALLLTQHHIVSDGWSQGVLMREVARLYDAFRNGQPSPLAPLSVQYADFAAWQRQWLGEGAEAEQVAYWREQLAGFEGYLDLPLDHPRPAVQSFAGAARGIQLTAELTGKLEALAQREGVTMYMLLLASLQLLLHRYSGQDDIAIGSPIAGRGVKQVEELIGFFVNTLVLRSRTRAGERFADFLARVRESALGAYAHQDVPFERLVEEVQPERSMAHTPLFQVMFAMQNTPVADEDAPSLGTLQLRHQAVEGTFAKFDQNWTAVAGERGLRIAVQYNRELFEAPTMERMLGHFRHILEQVAEDATLAVDALELLDDGERAQLAAWNDTARDYPEGALHELIEAQAARTPNAVALRFEGASLTYAELDRRAEQLAARLAERGVGAESVVGLCAERTMEMVIALLGILKAGAAYLPLDPENPAGRLRYMLSHSGARVALVQSRFAEIFADGGYDRLDLEEACADGDAERIRPRVLPENGAYVIYTSGTTGLPKGVMVPHRGIVNRLFWMQEAFGLGADDAVLQKTPYTFDVSVWEFFWPLMTGATLVIARPGGHRDPDYLSDIIEREGITTLHFVPSMLDAFLQAPAAAGLSGVRRVMCSGEALAPESVRRFHETFASAELHNLYGPTEASVDVSWWPAARDQEVRTVPIGKPIANTTLHVLDASFKPLPVGVAGELYIGGIQLARGYASDAAQTAERFVPDPLGGGRLYRTGDRARWLPTGEIEYLGRVDFQVKIRGYRIELGEIEHALAAHDGVRQAVVTARDDGAGDRRLVAYVVAEGGAPAAEELREALSAKLPEYMVPAHFVVLAELPLSRNGKVDLKALPEPDQEEAAGYVAPRTPTEELLAGIWARVLRRDRVGATDNFFHVGGHSLLATQLVSRIRESFAADVPLRAVFEAPTLEQLARRVDTAQRGEEVHIPAVDRDGPLPLSYAQERLWFLEQLDPGKPTYNIPLALRIGGELDEDALQRALREVIGRHEILRSHVEEIAGTPRLVVEEWPEWTWSSDDLSGLGVEEREARAAVLAREDAAAPFELTRGPLIRARFVRLAADEAMLLLTQHHIVSDGWSQGVLMREVARLYDAFRNGQPSPLAPLSVQYADFAAWQRQWLGEGAEAEQVAYWREQLAGFKGYLDLPLDRPRPAVQSFAGATRGIRLDAGLTRRLEALAQREGVTMYMLLLASLQLLLHRYSGQDDIAVGSPIAGRGVKQVEELIGFFVNTLVLRSRTRAGERFADFLARTRESALGAYAHQDVPFERLVEEVQPERSLAHTPLFQVSFAMQNTPGAEADESALQSLQLRHHAEEDAAAKFDQSWTSLPDGDGLRISTRFNRDLFEGETIERMLAHFRRILEQVADDATRPVAALELLDEEERRRVVSEWNPVQAPVSFQPVTAHFRARAAEQGERPALVDGARTLSYAELDQHSNRLAQHLLSLGLGAEDRVALVLPRGVEPVLAQLAVLKSGAAYVSLDASLPAERLRYMIEDSGARLAIAGDEVPAPGCAAPLLRWSEVEARLPSCPADDPRAEIAPGQLAYVIYTSGSTGRPKGVMVPHGGLSSLVAWHQAAYALQPRDRAPLLAGLGFDASVWELWPYLSSGASLHVVPDEVRASAEALQQFIEEHQLTLAFVPTVTAEALLRRPWKAGSLRALLTGGEKLSGRNVADLPFTVINHYGPTENTVVATAGAVTAGEGSPSIGAPLQHVRAYVLDEEMKPVPVGVPGELYLAGAGVARGYAGRARETAGAFVPDPFGNGGRLYRTGDRVRWLAAGELEFLGRADQQVKIRGYRIELGEIEAVLRAQAGVRDAVVEQVGGRLVGYVVAGEEEETLRDTLRRTLPEYMVPARIVALEALPLTPNGKVDRRALPAPDARREASAAAPRNAAELAVVRIMEEVLDVHPVGIHDDLFRLGGHSLLALRLVGRLEERFGHRVPLVELFRRGTAAHLAALVSGAARAEASDLIAIQPRGGQRPLFLVHGAGGSVFGYLELARHLSADQPLYGLQSRGMDGTAAPLETVEEMAGYYLELLREVQREGPYRLGGWSMGGIVAAEMARQLRAAGEEAEILVLIDSPAPHRVAGRPAPAGGALVAGFARELGVEGEALRAMSEEDALAELFHAAREPLGGELTPERLRLLFGVYRANTRALRRHDPPPGEGPALLFATRESAERMGDPTLGWSQALPAGELEVVELEGDHYGALKPPRAGKIAERLAELAEGDAARAVASAAGIV